MFGRTKIATLVAEFLGAAILTTVVLSVANSKIGFPLFIASTTGLAYGLILLTTAGARFVHANPAVTLSLWTIKKVETTNAIAYIAAQLLGGIAALRLFEYLSADVLSNIAGKTFDWRVFVAEVVGAFVFTFGLSAVIAQNYDGVHLGVAGAVSLMIGMVIASIASNGLINPAVALGINSISRVYMVAPLVGAVLGMNLYQMLYAPVRATKKHK